MEVCIIGAGPAGITTVKQLLDEGHNPHCFDKEATFAGSFGLGNARRFVDSLKLTISSKFMAFSDLMPKVKSRFWGHEEYREYLGKYVDTFNLQKYFTFRATVKQVKRISDHKWKVTVEKDGRIQERELDAVAVCSGAHQEPQYPTISSQSVFEGTWLHSSHYSNETPYKNKRVLIIGTGESASDIIREVATVSSTTTVVARRAPCVIPRLMYESHLPADMFTSRVSYPSRRDKLSHWVLCFFLALLALPFVLIGKLWQKLIGENPTDAFNQIWPPHMMDNETLWSKEACLLIESWSERENSSFLNKFATKNATWIPAVVDGRAKVHFGGIECFTPTCVVLADGETVEIDVVICCTGYKQCFPFLPEHYVPDADVRNLFKHAFSPNLGHTFALIGYARPTVGAVPAAAELTARYWALLLSKKRQLPNKLSALIIRDKKYEEKQHFLSPDVRTLVNPVDFFEEMASLIGCKPSYIHTCVTDPMLFFNLMVGPIYPSRYRLVGPHAMASAREEVLSSGTAFGHYTLITLFALSTRCFFFSGMLQRRM